MDQCFIYNNYSPVGQCERMYFQPENALKIDIIRLTIEKWYTEELITENEYFYLLSSLINAVPFVSNITGVYAAYLKFWDKRTYKTIKLTEPIITNNGKKMNAIIQISPNYCQRSATCCMLIHPIIRENICPIIIFLKLLQDTIILKYMA